MHVSDDSDALKILFLVAIGIKMTSKSNHIVLKDL